MPSFGDACAFVAAYLWAVWAIYVLVMGVYRAHLAKRLGPITFVMALPIVCAGLVMDALANVTIATLVFWERPYEWLVTARLKRYVSLGGGWRFTIANWICNNMLDVFDPSGNHC